MCFSRLVVISLLTLASQDCLNAIVQIFREASAIIDAIEDNPTLSHAPILRLLAESIKEAPSEIEKEKNRATLRFGEAFQYGDYTAICSLQQVALQLRSGFLELLQPGIYDRRPTDVARLVDAVDTGRHTTIVTLHDLKQRLVQSGYGSYHQPGPLSHPAHQPPRHSGAHQSCQPVALPDTLTPQGHHSMSGGCGARGGHVEEESSHSSTSVTSNDNSLHVHFRKNDISAQAARRRGSIMGYLKHGRTKRSNLLVDSKRMSDELAESRRKDVSLSQRPKKAKASVGLSEMVTGVAELDGMPIVGHAK